MTVKALKTKGTKVKILVITGALLASTFVGGQELLGEAKADADAFVAKTDIIVNYNSENVSSNKFITNDSILIDSGFLEKNLGFGSRDSKENGFYVFTKDNVELKFEENSSSIYKNGEMVNRSVVSSRVIEGKLYIPLRVTSELMGLSINWDGGKRVVDIQTVSCGKPNGG